MSARNYLNDVAHQVAGNLFNRAAKRVVPGRPGRPAAIEALESRLLLSASISINAANQLAFLGDPGNDDVTVSFAPGAAGGTYTINDSAATIDIVSNNASAVTTAGSGTNTVTVTDLSSLPTASLSFDGNGNGGVAPGDTFNIQSSNDPISIDQTGSVAAHDTYYLGNTTDGVQSILAPVSLQDTTGAADLTIDDSADASAQAFTLAGGSSVSTITNLAPGLITYANGQISSLTIDGGSGNDDLTVDFSGGNPIPTLSTPGLIYSAGGGSDNVLNLVGAPPSGQFASVVPKATGRGSGSITFVDQNSISTELTYAHLTPLTDTTPATNYTFNDDGYPDQSFSATSGPIVSAFQTLQFTSTPTPSSPLNFETTDIANKGFVTFNTPPETPGLAGQGIDATINIPVASTGLLSLAINTPTGGDNTVSFVNTPAGVVTSYTNDGASSTTNVTGLGVAGGTVLFLNGGPGINALNYDAGGEIPTITPGLLPGEVLITIPGSGVVDAINYTQIKITDVSPLTINGSPTATIKGVQGAPIVNALVSTFTAPVLVLPPPGGFPASDFTASITWGDGTPTAAGTITEDAENPNVYSITATHTYAANGTFTVTSTAVFDGGMFTTPVNGIPVMVTFGGGSNATVNSTVSLQPAPLTGSIGNMITGVEGSSTGTVLLGAFIDANPNATAAEYTAGGGSVVVNWGDGSAPQTLAASNLTQIGAPGAGEWTINAAHTYVEEGTYAYTATVTGANGAATIVSGSAVIADAPLIAGAPIALTPTPGVPLPNSTVVATFTDANTFATTGDFTDLIDWGDGSPQSTGVVVPTATPGVFDIEAGHTYATPDNYTTLVTVHDDGGSLVVISGSADISSYAPDFSNLSNSTITIHAASETFTGKIAAGSVIPTGDVNVTLAGVTKTVAIKSNGTFSATFNTSKLAVGKYTVAYNYAGNSEFDGAIDTSTLDVTYGTTSLHMNTKYNPGSVIWLQILMSDASGKDVNTTHTAVTTTGIALASSPGTLLPSVDVGETFTPNSVGDVFTLYLKTTGLAPGQYILYFTITGDPLTHSATFTIG